MVAAQLLNSASDFIRCVQCCLMKGHSQVMSRLDISKKYTVPHTKLNTAKTIKKHLQ